MLRAPLRQALALGQILIWGRVETESLPDLYARSFLVVMPSKREQFGLVALEAMACGAPVVATNTGGLADVVVDGYTGVLICNSDSTLLANTIAAYLRDPERRHFHGVNAAAWVRFGFEQERVYSRFIEAYSTDTAINSSGFPSVARQRVDQLDQIKTTISELIGDKIFEIIDCSTSLHICCKIITASGCYFGKSFVVEPTRSPAVLPLPRSLRGYRFASELSSRYKFNAGNFATPLLKSASEDSSLIVTEWCEQAAFSSSADERNAIRHLASDFHAFASPHPSLVLSQYEQALDRVIREPSSDSIAVFDHVVAKLNSELTGGVLRFGHNHPFVELLRYRELIARHIWALPEGFRIRAAAVIEHALSDQDFYAAPLLLCHGSLQARHLLFARQRIVACDLDSCRFAVGPMDEAHYIFSRLAQKEIGPITAVNELREMAPGKQEFQLALAWLVSYLLFEALYAISRGKIDLLELFIAFSDTYLSDAYLFGYDETQKAAG